MTTLPEPPRTPLVEPGSSMLSRPWVVFFDQLRRVITSGLDDAVGGRLDALEADAVFDGSDSSGGGTSYNDATLRGRLDAIETEILFPAPSSGTDDAELTARMALLEQSAEEEAVAAIMAPDPAAAVALLRSRVAAVEIAQAMTVLADAQLRRIERRMADLETVQAAVTPFAEEQLRRALRRLSDLETEGLFA